MGRFTDYTHDDLLAEHAIQKKLMEQRYTTPHDRNPGMQRLYDIEAEIERRAQVRKPEPN